MSLRFIDHPRYCQPALYTRVIDQVLERATRIPEVLAVYQIGHVSDPGISDIDLFCIFRDNASCTVDLRRHLDNTGRYLLVHNLFGTASAHFEESQQFTFFHNYNLLFGDNFPSPDKHTETEELRVLKHQVALEYLTKFYISLNVQLHYRIIKLRSLLLEAKALKYDLEFLGCHAGEVYESVGKIIAWRKNWFNLSPARSEIIAWLLDFRTELGRFLEERMHENPLAVPQAGCLHFSRNIRLKPGDGLRWSAHGFALPRHLSFLGRRYFNLQHRLNQFSLELPMSIPGNSSVLLKRLAYMSSVMDYNRRYLPHFSPLISSLNFTKSSFES